MCPLSTCVSNLLRNFCRLRYPANGSNFRHGSSRSLSRRFSLCRLTLFCSGGTDDDRLVVVTLVFLYAGFKLQQVFIFELKYDNTDLEHSVGLIGRVKDIVEELPEDPENEEPVFVNPAIQARLEYGRENEKDSLALFSSAWGEGSNFKRSFETVNNYVLQSTNRNRTDSIGKHKSNAEESSTEFENNENVTQIFVR